MLNGRKRRPTHPGEILREDVLPETGLTQGEFARLLGVSRRTVKICNQKGLHARAAARFVKTAHDFDAAHREDPKIPQLERPWPWSEILASDGRAIAEKHGLEPWMQDVFDVAGWLVYRKR